MLPAPFSKPAPSLEERSAAPDPEMDRLFALALEGKLPRKRELKSWEPDKLNERHLAMITARVAGFQQRQIARAFGATDANVSIVLNHPDAEFLLAKLTSRKAQAGPSSIEQRLQALAEPAVSVLEDILQGDTDEAVKLALRKERSAFKVLDMNGHGQRAPQKHEHEHLVRFNPTAPQAVQLANVLREAQALKEIQVVERLPEQRDVIPNRGDLPQGEEEGEGPFLSEEAPREGVNDAPSVDGPNPAPQELS